MNILTDFFGFFRPGIPLVAALVFGSLMLMGIRALLDKRYKGQADKSMKLQLIMMMLSFVLLVVVIIVSPINDSQKGQILSLIGIVLSATIALSATTFVGNAMAGFMLRSIRGFKVGDFISVSDNFGRVSERGLFHTEIQTEQRDLITLPNLHLVTHPVKVVRSSGTIVWAEVSLGYDVPRTRIKTALLKAGEQCGLQEAFVHVMNLGDYSVVYRISGLLTEVKQLVSARSRIRECTLDELHASGIEIVSPTFMNTRPLTSEAKFIPKTIRESAPSRGEAAPEDIVFDKAEDAVTVAQLRASHEEMSAEIKALEKSAKETEDPTQKSAIQVQIDTMKTAHRELGVRVDEEQQKADNNE
jgi:small conductance mechanosensitive channel